MSRTFWPVSFEQRHGESREPFVDEVDIATLNEAGTLPVTVCPLCGAVIARKLALRHRESHAE